MDVVKLSERVIGRLYIRLGNLIRKIFVRILGHKDTLDGVAVGRNQLCHRTRTAGEHRVYLLHHVYVVQPLVSGQGIAYVFVVSHCILLSVHIVGDIAVVLGVDLSKIHALAHIGVKG